MRAIHPEDWSNGTPPRDGEYLCIVNVPKKVHGGRVRHAHTRYMALQYYDGGFWINNGMPQGMVACWIELRPNSLSSAGPKGSSDR